MSIIYSAFKYSAAVALALMLTAISYAQCATCSGGQTSFGFPGAACAACAGHTNTVGPRHREVLAARWEQSKAYNQKILARNLAWPKPFACGDRSLYHVMMQPMLNAGVSDQNTLWGIHFDDNGKLSRYGKQQIAGIMNNMPSGDKIVYLRREGDEATTRDRLAQVNEVVSTWYGKTGAVRLTGRNPIIQNGVRAEAITNNYFNALSPPVIPVAAGNESINQAVGN